MNITLYISRYLPNGIHIEGEAQLLLDLSKKGVWRYIHYQESPTEPFQVDGESRIEEER